MTIKTLNYIHQLLIREEETRRAARNTARKAAAEVDRYDGPLAEVADKAYHLWSEAHEALMDFEAKEW